MTIWVLRPHDEDAKPWRPWYDKSFGFVVVAETESAARAIAAEFASDEGAAVWTDPALTMCVVLDASAPGLVMEDFRAG